MGLMAGLVPTRLRGPAKQALLDLVSDAAGAGFSLRQACVWLGINHSRVLAWQELNRPGFRSYRVSCPAVAGWGDSWSA